MEPNTAYSSAAKTSSEIVKQEPSSFVNVRSLLSPPPFFAPQSHELISTTDSRFESPAVEDMFTLQAPATTLFSVPLDGQPWQGLAQPPSWAALGLPACSSVSGFSEFANQMAALEKTASWPQSGMPFILPTIGFGLPICGNDDNYITFGELSSKYKLAPPSIYNMLSAFGETIPWHCGESSLEFGSSVSSIPNLSIKDIKMKAAMLPLTPPLSHGAGASSNFIGFTHPSSNSKPTEFWASLQEVPLPVKQEPIDAVNMCHDLEFKPLNKEEDEPNQEVIPNWMPANSIASGQSWSWEAALRHPEQSRNNISGTRIAVRAHYQNQSSFMAINNSSSTPKLSQTLPPSSARAGASSSHNHVTGVTFTNAEKEIIRKDKNLQELVNTHPKKVKRLVSNRICAAKRKVIKDMRTLELERQVETLQRKCNTKSAELKLSQERCAELKTEYNQMSMRMQELERQLKLKEGM